MTVLAIVCTLISSFAWTAYDIYRKKLSFDFEPISLASLLMLGQAPFFLAWAALEGQWFFKLYYLIPGGASIALNLVAHVLFVKSMKLAPISETIPLLSLTPALSVIGGYFLLGESVTLVSLFGIALILCGTLLITGVKLKLSESKTTGLIYMGIVAVLWSFTPALDKLAFSYTPPPVHALLQVLVIYIILQFLGFGINSTSINTLKAHKFDFLVAITIAAIAVATQFKALAIIAVGIFESSKRGIAMGLTLVFGYLLFSEPITTRKVAAVALITVGVGIVFSPEFASN